MMCATAQYVDSEAKSTLDGDAFYRLKQKTAMHSA